MDKLDRLKWLTEEVNKHNKNYYTYDNPTISDAEYDKLYYELVDLEKELNFKMPNTPTERASPAGSRFTGGWHFVRLRKRGGPDHQEAQGQKG